MFVEISVTGLTSLVIIHLQYCLAKTCITSKPNFLTLVFDTFILYHKMPQCMVCHEETRTSLHDQHFLCEECCNHWIDVKDRSVSYGTGLAEARESIRFSDLECDENRDFIKQLFYLLHFYCHIVNVLLMLPFNQMIDDLY